MNAEDIIKRVGQPIDCNILIQYYKSIVNKNLNPDDSYENSLRHYSLKELKKLEEILDEEKDNEGTASI